MDDAEVQLAPHPVESEVTGLTGRERRVVSTIAKRLHISRDVNMMHEESQTIGGRLADKVARFGGSWAFILIFIGILLGWVSVNTLLVSRLGQSFDPYPFIFLNFILSMVAALQAPVILMSQNRQAARDRVAAGLDYEINLKSELEIMALHEKLDRIRIEHLEEVLREQSGQLRALLEHAAAHPAAASASTLSGTRPAGTLDGR